ncbi:diacylglycerol/lipid kinase family protein [Sporosarcina cyprini]|uniref:diacylglycerol/lipid kinase family protein n=1 Tax=Sporosarcina cyprini TaxID=2910523 RepID=UPI001EDF511F|nr:diacylglycerol kinase family protein [Sporosarcina cyprini]MCG3088839.1 hypothetical protein [Sporosarcina cyprini]
MYVLICNRNAGNSSALQKLEVVKRQLDGRKIAYHALISDSANATALFLQQFVASCKAVVIIGGDGTLHSVLQICVPSQVPIAFLPSGSGNDSARNLGITEDPLLFVERLLLHNEVQLDALSVNGIYGLTVAGFGLDASIGERAETARYKSFFNKIGLGSLTYSVAAVLDLMTFQPYSSKLIVDGKGYEFPVTWLMSCGNMKYYGGGLEICPKADPLDGKMNLTVLHGASRWRILFSLFPALLRGGIIEAKEVMYASGKEVRIVANRKLPLVVDGEIYWKSEASIQIVPSIISFLTT